MNQYGAIAQEHWRRHRPAELAQVEDPERFFTDLGEQVLAEIRARREALENGNQGELGEGFLANLGRLNEIQSTVESDVLREMIYTEPETDTEPVS